MRCPFWGELLYSRNVSYSWAARAVNPGNSRSPAAGFTPTIPRLGIIDAVASGGRDYLVCATGCFQIGKKLVAE